MTDQLIRPDQLSEEVERKVFEVTNSLRQTEKKRRFDLDVRGLLAIITIIGFFLVVFAQLVISTVQGTSTAGAIRIPAEVAAVVTGVAGFYFGSRSGANGR